MAPIEHEKPRIGVPWRTRGEELQKTRKKLDYYFQAIRGAGAEPEEISLAQPPDLLDNQLKSLDAFVLPGSPADLDPALYGATRNEKTQDADPSRERTDSAILSHAFTCGKPVLAICYGCQSLNVFLRGSLYQDIASELNTKIRHSRQGLPPEALDPFHPARIEPGGELGQLAATCGLENRDGGFGAQVNTSHHQSIRDLGHGLCIAAVAPDGVIEAVEHETHKHWVVGVQWHPERMFAGGAPGALEPFALKLFRDFVAAARGVAAHKV